MKWQAACADSNVEPPTVAHVEQKMKGTALPHTHLFIIDREKNRHFVQFGTGFRIRIRINLSCWIRNGSGEKNYLKKFPSNLIHRFSSPGSWIRTLARYVRFFCQEGTGTFQTAAW
jgi:hypothetical protein